MRSPSSLPIHVAMDDDNLNFDFLDFDFAHDNNTIPSLLSWLNQGDDTEVQLNSSSSVPLDTEGIDTGKESTRKRLRTEECCKTETKAVREKLRRERFSEKFLELSSIIDPGRPVRSDRVAILSDAVRLLKKLKTEAQELEEASKNLTEEINNLKAEKHELREEKVALKAEKDRVEQQFKMITSTSLMAPHPTSYHPIASKMTPMFPGFGMVPVPMWQYLPPAAVDTSKDHELRPPAA